MTASSLAHGMSVSMRARNFSRRVVFFLPANSAWAKVVWWVMPRSVEPTRAAVCQKTQGGGLNQRFINKAWIVCGKVGLADGETDERPGRCVVLRRPKAFRFLQKLKLDAEAIAYAQEEIAKALTENKQIGRAHV